MPNEENARVSDLAFVARVLHEVALDAGYPLDGDDLTRLRDIAQPQPAASPVREGQFCAGAPHHLDWMNGQRAECGSSERHDAHRFYADALAPKEPASVRTTCDEWHSKVGEPDDSYQYMCMRPKGHEGPHHDTPDEAPKTGESVALVKAKELYRLYNAWESSSQMDIEDFTTAMSGLAELVRLIEQDAQTLAERDRTIETLRADNHRMMVDGTKMATECGRREREIETLRDKERLHDELIAVLINHCGERGQSEGAVDTLKRIIAERGTALSDLADARRCIKDWEEGNIEWQKVQAERDVLKRERDEAYRNIKVLQDAAQTTYNSREEWERAFHEVCSQRDGLKRELDQERRIRDNRAHRVYEVGQQWSQLYPLDMSEMDEAMKPAADEAPVGETGTVATFANMKRPPKLSREETRKRRHFTLPELLGGDEADEAPAPADNKFVANLMEEIAQLRHLAWDGRVALEAELAKVTQELADARLIAHQNEDNLIAANLACAELTQERDEARAKLDKLRSPPPPTVTR